jgi:putative hemolysin
MNSLPLNIAIVLALILIEGVFVAAEIALVSLREGQVRAMAERGRRGQAVARLVRDPNRFLAAVQIGVTSTALLSSAYGAVTLSDSAKDALIKQGWSKGWAAAIGIIGVTLAISFVTLVLGELVPKRLALQRTEAAAQLFAPPLARIATFFRPVIWLLSKSTNGVVRLLGADPGAGREPISDQELRGLVAAHESLTSDERRLIDEVFAASERTVSEVMLPRTDVIFFEATMTVSRAAKLAGESPHSRYPVIGRSQDDILGFVHIRDLVLGGPANGDRGDRPDHSRTVGELLREIKLLPGSKNVLSALSEMRRERHQLAIVLDEYGGTDGIVTLEDLIEEVIGDIRDEYDAATVGARRLIGGAVEVDGTVNLDELAELTDLELPDGPYETVGGFLMAELGRLPLVGDVVPAGGYQLAVIALDGRRAARVLVSPPKPDNPDADNSSSDNASGADPESAAAERAPAER